MASLLINGLKATIFQIKNKKWSNSSEMVAAIIDYYNYEHTVIVSYIIRILLCN